MTGVVGTTYKAHGGLWLPKFGSSVSPGQAQPALKVVTTGGGSYQLQDVSGNQWVARGVTEWSVAEAGINDSSNGNYASSAWTNLSKIIAGQQSYNVNMVRLRIGAGYYNGLSSANQTAYVNQIVTRLADAKAQGAILMLTAWDALGDGAAFATNYTKYDALFQAICTATGNDPWLVWNPVNEPNDASTGTLTWSLWTTAMEHLISVLRTAGYKGPIVVDGINWANSGASGLGYSDSVYTAIETYDSGLLSGHHQIVFSVHQYWYPSWTTIGWSLSRFTSIVLGGSTTHCFLLSEVGYDNAAPNEPSPAWSSAMMPDIASLPGTMPNFAGSCGFVWGWVDDNTLISISDWTSLSPSWGPIYVNDVLKGPFAPGGNSEVTAVSSPTVAGTFQVGDTLTATQGVYQNAVSVTRRWTNCTTDQQGVQASQVTIPGATGLTYKLQASDTGLLVTYEETATGSNGDTVIRHAWGTTPVAAAGQTGVASEDFAAEWFWGQGQGGPGGSSLNGVTTPPNTAWVDNFTQPVPAGGPIAVSPQNDLWGTIETADPSYYGLPALPAGLTGQCCKLECTAAEVANIPNTGYGAVMAKLFAAFGTEQTGNNGGIKPPNVSGTYSAYYFFESNYAVPATTADWINLQQFKQSQSNGQNDPMWWVNVSSYYWAKQTQSSTPWASSARPVLDTDPVMYLNCWGGPIVPMLMTVPKNRWFKLQAVVTQNTSIVWTLDGAAFSTAPQSHYPVSPDSSHPGRWIYGIGNYATFASRLFGAYSTFTP